MTKLGDGCSKDRSVHLAKELPTMSPFSKKESSRLCRIFYNLANNCNTCPIINEQNLENIFNPWLDNKTLNVVRAVSFFPTELLHADIKNSYTQFSIDNPEGIIFSLLTENQLHVLENSPGFLLLIYPFDENYFKTKEDRQITRFYQALLRNQLISSRYTYETKIPNILDKNRRYFEQFQKNDLIGFEKPRGLGDEIYDNITKSILNWIKITSIVINKK